MKKKLLFLSMSLTIFFGINAQYHPSGNVNPTTWYYSGVACIDCGNFYNSSTGMYGNVINDAGLELINQNGFSDAYDGAFELALGSLDSVYTAGLIDTLNTSFLFEEQMIDSFYLSKSYYFESEEAVVRAVFKVRNPYNYTRNADVYISSNFGSDEATTIDTTTNGTINLTNSDRWFTSWDYGDWDPILTWCRFGPGAVEAMPVLFDIPGGSTDPFNYVGGNDNFTDVFSFSVPANSYKLIAIFNRMDSSALAARNKVHIFDDIDSVNSYGYLDGLSSEELLNIVNWDYSSLVCSPNLSTNVNGITISANQSGATYQWIDCENGNAPINGETSQSFVPSLNGNYAVIITTSNTCSDTSSCVSISTVGIVDNAIFNKVSINPNPSNGLFSVQTETPSNIEISNLTGATIRVENNFQNKHDFDLSNEPNGVYLIKISVENQSKTFKFVKK